MRRFLFVGAFALAAASPATASPVSHATVGSCNQRVQFALVDARTTGCLTLVSTNPDTYESTDTVNLNGIPLKAIPGTKLVLKAPTSSAPGGSIAVNTSITLAGVTVFNGGFDYNLPAGNPGDLKTLASLSPPAGAKIKGFSLGGSVSIQLGKDATGDQQGYSRFELVVKLPDVFRNSPGQGAGGLTGTVAIRTDASGVHADTLKIEVSNAYIGQVLLKNLCLSFVSASSQATACSPPGFGASLISDCKTTGTDRWDGSALITLPTASRPDVGVFAGTTNGSFAYAGATVSGLGTSAPLAPGVYLDRVGLAVCLNPPPLKLKGSVGIRFGPNFNGTQAAFLSGSVQYTDSRPWVLQANGSLSLFDKNVASGFFTYKSDGAIDFGFDVNWDFYSVLDITGGVSGWYQPSGQTPKEEFVLTNPVDRQRYNNFQGCLTRPFPGFLSCFYPTLSELLKVPRRTVYVPYPAKFDVFGHAKVCAVKIICVGGEAAVSSVGVAGCAEATVFGYPEPYWFGVRWVQVKVRAGAGYRWGSGRVDTMGSSCDVGPYRASKSAVIAASGHVTIHLDHSPAATLRVRGLHKPPKVEVTGPDGRKLMLNRAGQLKKNDYYYVENPKDNTTSVMISDPAAGIWTITPLPGSSPIVSVSEAPVHPDPTAAGRVIGHGRTLALEYALESSPGMTVTFWERGANYERQLGVAAGKPCLQNEPIAGKRPADAFMAHPQMTCGVIPFIPDPGPAGERNIIGVVSNNGEPVSEFKVTSYKYGGEGVPPRPQGLRIARQGTTVTITWEPSAGAVDYDVDLMMSNGQKVVDVTGKKDRHVVLHNIAPSATVTVKVSGLRVDDVAGPAATAVSQGHGKAPILPFSAQDIA